MAKVRYHMTPNGPRPCLARVRGCPYGNEAHYYDEVASSAPVYNEDSSLVNLSSSEFLQFNSKEKERILSSEEWGAELADMIDEHVASKSLSPKQISFKLDSVEELVPGEPETAQGLIVQAIPRLDSTLNAYSNIYRVYAWDPADEKASLTAKMLVKTDGANDYYWNNIAESDKWEVAFGAFVDEDTYLDNRKKNIQAKRAVLNHLNDVDSEKLANILSSEKALLKAKALDQANYEAIEADETYQAKLRYNLEKRAANILSIIQSAEVNLMSPYDAYDRGLGFYRLDANNRTVIDENLSTTSVRGRNLVKLGVDADVWMRGVWRGDANALGESRIMGYKREERAVNNTKGMPYRSPMTFWTSSTPDGSRWELAMDIHTPESGSHRVRYFDDTMPDAPAEVATPTNAVDGFNAMKSAMEAQYGESGRWPKKLKRDMRVLEEIAGGHNAMVRFAKKAEESYAKEMQAYEDRLAGKDEHDLLFGKKLGKLFG